MSGILQPSLSTIKPVVLDGIINMTSQYTVDEQANMKKAICPVFQT